jgi:hypothetical protein
VSSNLTVIVIVVSVIHVAVFAVMVWIRVRPCEADAVPVASAESANIAPCVVCGEPATHRSYDGLDPDQQYDPGSGQYWSAEMAHYPPLCAVH